MSQQIKPKEREVIIQSLRSGVVPRLGLQHIQVGRDKELKSFIKDIDTLAGGGATFRFVIGEYGSGKSFFLSLIRSIALEKGLVTMHADLSPSKRFYGRSGQSRMLISELVSNMATRTKQEGGALAIILDNFLMSIYRAHPEMEAEKIISSELRELNNYPCGFSFSSVVSKYWLGYKEGNEDLKNNALKWLRAEYNSRTDAYRELGVRDIITDTSFYDTLKLFSLLIQKAGYKGLLICLDELVNLYKITSSVSRRANYEELLYMLNNTLQGAFPGFGFILCGTPEFLKDERRGLYSYDALRSRLIDNSFAKQLGVTDYSSTVLSLSNLSKEELFVLLKKLRYVFSYGDSTKFLISDDGLLSFMHHCESKIGDSYFRTPRTTIKSFLDLLSTLEQYPSYSWSDLIKRIVVERDVEPSNIVEQMGPLDNEEAEDFSSFSSFKI